MRDGVFTEAPSPHEVSLAGIDLESAPPPVIRVEVVRETVVVASRARARDGDVHVERCRADGVAIVARPSGGGAVVLAPGAVAASALIAGEAAPSFPDRYFRLFGDAVAAALADVGVAGVTMRGISDLCLGDRKIAGSSLRLWRGRVLYQISVLVDMDLTLIDRYLATPTRMPAYRRGRPHAQFVTSLRQAGYTAPITDVTAAIERALRHTMRLDAPGRLA